MDKARMGIRLEKLKVPCVVGVYETERHASQDLLLDMDISFQQHPHHLGSDTYLDYAGLSTAITFFCKSANFGLLEDALVALDALAWSLIPKDWLAHASVAIELRKPCALSDAGVPVVYGHTQMPSQRSIFIKGTGFRLARLAAWQQGALWSLFSDGARHFNFEVKGDLNLLVTQGDLQFADHVVSVGEYVHLQANDRVSCKSTGDMEVLVYRSAQEVPLIKAPLQAETESLLRVRPISLFATLGIPSNETFAFNELIWAKARHPHFAAELQMTQPDTDVAAKVALPSVIRSS